MEKKTEKITRNGQVRRKCPSKVFIVWELCPIAEGEQTILKSKLSSKLRAEDVAIKPGVMVKKRIGETKISFMSGEEGGWIKNIDVNVSLFNHVIFCFQEKIRKCRN